MTKLLFPLLILMLISCSSEKPHTCDCSECEEQLKKFQLIAPPAPIDLPEKLTEQPRNNSQENQLTVYISKSGSYSINGIKYNVDQLKQGLDKAMSESTTKIQDVKIAGNEETPYRYIFRIMVFCQSNGWNPILAYDK